MNRTIAIAGATALSGLFLLVGCTSQLTSLADNVATGEESSIALDTERSREPYAEDSFDGYLASNAQAASGLGTKADPQPRVNNGAEAEVEQDRLIVRTASMVVVVEFPDQVLEHANQIASDVGGTVTATRAGERSCDLPKGKSKGADPIVCRPGSGVASTTVTLRIPVATFDETLLALSDTGEVAQLSSDSDDVTEAVVDVKARIKTQKESVKRVRALLAEANSINEIVTVEKELTKRQSDLEALVAREDSLTDSAAMSTITATFTTDSSAGSITWLDEAGEAFATAWKTIFVGIALLSPLIVVFAIVALVIYIAVNRRRRNESLSAAEQSPPQAEREQDITS